MNKKRSHSKNIRKNDLNTNNIRFLATLGHFSVLHKIVFPNVWFSSYIFEWNVNVSYRPMAIAAKKESTNLYPSETPETNPESVLTGHPGLSAQEGLVRAQNLKTVAQIENCY